MKTLQETLDARSQIRDRFPFPSIYASTDIEEIQKFVKQNFGMDYQWIGTSGEHTAYINNDNDEVISIIYLNPNMEGASNRYAVLAHEVNHALEAWLDHMKIENTGDEYRSYFIQCAMLSCVDQIGEDWFIGEQKQDTKKKGK